MQNNKMTLMQHFAELRRRVVWTLLCFALFFGIGFFITAPLQEFLISPLMSVWSSGAMLYTGLTDGIMIEFSLATLFACVFAIPVLLWQIWAFAAPGLKIDERKFLAPILIISPLLFVIGAAFAFYILFPIVFQFFVSLNESAPVPAAFLPAITDYLSFTIGLLKIFGLAFQLPLVLVLLNRAGVVSRAAVIKSRRYAICGIFIVAAILTPPDVLSQILLAVPLMALFELSILFMKR
ncbi:MAG: twin-arginine translocase subunit TatC [Rickettsiales bacterium]|jgi:sec-independent protein translocase protein TatC|nr:twin-arginine translocase subunit TatC [Rickettsiales bacterium]